GLTVAATLDTNTYPRGIKITDREMKAFEARYLHRHDFHGNWKTIWCQSVASACPASACTAEMAA
ncbi:MAG: ISAzo13-like element transposase-related protein, partial [Pseudonocardiaceae bacterium]